MKKLFGLICSNFYASRLLCKLDRDDFHVLQRAVAAIGLIFSVGLAIYTIKSIGKK